MKLILRMRAENHRRLADLLRAAMPSESVAFMLCRRIVSTERTVFLVDQVIEVLRSDYVDRDHDIASVSPLGMARVAQKARESGLVIVMAHLHPMCPDEVEFSQADHLGNQKSFAFFHRRARSPEHIALVWNAPVDRCLGLVYRADGSTQVLDSLVVVDDESWGECVPFRGEWQESTTFSRQALMLGEAGQSRLHRIRLGIVGLGGLGSLISMAAVHHGFKEIALIDDDVIEQSNLPRVVGSGPHDVLSKRSKVDIAATYAISHDPSCRVDKMRTYVEDPTILSNLASLDVIVVCTDNTTSRAFVNQLAHQHLIPVMDLGLEFVVDAATGRVANEVGRVNLMRPGSPCLWCTGHINAKRLAAESVPRGERKRVDSYIRGIDDPQPSMLAFNMEVAARGMQVLTGFLTGLFSTDASTFEMRTFLRRRGSSLSRLVSKVVNHDCIVCGDQGVTSRGDALGMSVTRRAA